MRNICVVFSLNFVSVNIKNGSFPPRFRLLLAQNLSFSLYLAHTRPFSLHLTKTRIPPSLIYVNFYPYCAYLTQFRSQNTIRKTILSPSAAILIMAGIFFFLGSSLFFSYFCFFVVWHVYAMFYPYWAYLTQFRIQNITKMTILSPIGGHFGFWRPSCFLKIIQIIIVA